MMADFCQFISLSAGGGDRLALSRLRTQLAHGRESFGICLQALSQLLGLNLNDLILYDRSFVMKDDVVSIYLSGGLPDGMSELIADLQAQSARKHAVAVQFGKLLKECVQHGLDYVVKGLDVAPAKDLYSRSIACLLRINMCALKVECDLRRRVGEIGAAGIDCVLDETGTSLCELLSRCCLILCIFGAEESNLFDDVREVQETLLRLVPGPLVLHIIGAFAVVAFDNTCLFSLQSRRVFVESLVTILPELLDRILLFNRLGTGGTTDVSGSRHSKSDSSIGGSTSLGSTWNSSQLSVPVPGITGVYREFDRVMGEMYHGRTVIKVGTPYWEYAFGNIPRVRTLSLLLDFILLVMKVCNDGGVDKQMFGWLDALVTKPSFLHAFKPIFSSGDTSNFQKILEISRILGKDICVSHLILSVRHNSRDALGMIRVAGPSLLMSDTTNRSKILSFLVDGVLKDPQAFISCWYDFLNPLVLGSKDKSVTSDRTDSWSANMIMDGPLSEVGERLLEAVIPHSLMRNFGDEFHPDEDNVYACNARQLMVLLVEVLGRRRIASRLNRFIEAAYRLMQERVTLDTVQVFEFAVFSMWLLRMYELNVRNKKLYTFMQDVDERTLQSTIVMYRSGDSEDSVSVRLEALECIKKRIRASRLHKMVLNHDPWYCDHQLSHATSEDWQCYYRDFGDEMLKQLTELIFVCPFSVSPSAIVPVGSGRNIPKFNANGKRSRNVHNVMMRRSIKPSVDDGRLVLLSEYISRAKLLLHLHNLNMTEEIPDDVYATILGVLVHFDVAECDCIEILERMLVSCPVQILHRVVESGVKTLNVALMNAMSRSLNERYADVLCAMMGMILSLKSVSGDSVGILISLMHLVSKSVTVPKFFSELISGEDELATLQNFIVFANGLKLMSHAFLESRCTMNQALIECYLQYEVPYTPVPVLEFVQNRVQRLMEVRAAQFSVVLTGTSDLLPSPPAAKGELNTLDLIVVTTFELFVLTNSPPGVVRRGCWRREDNDVFHWNLVGREYYIALKTITLLFKCFCQLTMTKLMFIAEHFIGVAARMNGDKHSTARRRILTDDSLVSHDAIEYFYQVYCNVTKRYRVAHASSGVKERVP